MKPADFEGVLRFSAFGGSDVAATEALQWNDDAQLFSIRTSRLVSIDVFGETLLWVYTIFHHLPIHF